MEKVAVGLDIGGTRIKMGITELNWGRVLASRVFPTERVDEATFYRSIRDSLKVLLDETALERSALEGVGVSIGSYVYADGTLDGMSCFVKFMTCGYPLRQRLEATLGLPVAMDNDARLIGQAEALYGAGRGFDRVLTLTLGSGIGVGLCVGGQPVGNEARQHLAGHLRVRGSDEPLCPDEPPCYCGIDGCFESSCSGTALERYAHYVLSPDIDNRTLFELAASGNPGALACRARYLTLLSRALNQYIYLYCPDVIVLGGGVSASLGPLLGTIQNSIRAKVNQRQQTVIRLAELQKDGGIIGSTALFLC